MARFRYSLSALLAIMVVAAIVFGVWRLNKQLGASLVLIICLWALCAATVAALSGTRQSQRSWLPFAVFGWGYFWTSLGIHAYGLPGSALAEYLTKWNYTSDNSIDSGTLRLALEPVFALLFGFLAGGVYHLLSRLWSASNRET